MRQAGVERGSALESLISWMIEMGLDFPMVRSELNYPSVTKPENLQMKKMTDGPTNRLAIMIIIHNLNLMVPIQDLKEGRGPMAN